MKLICVVLKDESPNQYEDTISLFEYGFANFERAKVAQLETKYNIDNTGLFYSGNDIFGNSQPLLTLNQEDYIILPKTISFEDATSDISYETSNEKQAAVIFYTYAGVSIGSVRVNYVANQEDSFVFNALPEDVILEEEPDKPVIYVNKTWIIRVLAVIIFIIVIRIFIYILRKNFAFPGRDRRRRGRRRRRR